MTDFSTLYYCNCINSAVLFFCDQIHQRELADSLKLRERQVEIDALSESVRAEEQRLDGLDVSNLARERASLNHEIEKLAEEVLLLTVDMIFGYATGILLFKLHLKY